MQVDDPPYLSVGTAVSAKYKGAFCEAKVSKVVRLVKCKVTYKMGFGTDTVSDDQIKGALRVGQVVQVKHPGRKEFVEATITKIQDCSQYTVVFDDGDITTLRRSALCLKSGRHFNESETLDQLPLTHPEHFSNPVVGGRRGRRNRHLRDESSEGEPEEENELDLEGYSPDIGRVVSVETTDKKRGKDHWFPGLVVIPSAQPTVKINVKDEYLIRSFKDGRYYTVPKKEVNDFSRDFGDKAESSVLAEAVDKALKYLDQNELPVHWERNLLFNSQPIDSDSDENYSDSSDDEPCEEKDRFVAQLYKFMDDAGTPLNKSPTIGNRDVDLYKLFSIVYKFGGYNKVTNNSKWRAVTMRLRYTNNQNTMNQVKQVYKKCLLSYESFHRTLGVTMLNHTRSTKKNKGRSLIRDKDRATPVNSPKPEREEEIIPKKEIPPKVIIDEKQKKKIEPPKEEKKKKEEISDASGSEVSDHVVEVAIKETPRIKRNNDTKIQEKKPAKSASVEKVKSPPEKNEDAVKKEEEKQTRSKSLQQKTSYPCQEKKIETKSKETKLYSINKPTKKNEDEKKRGRKRALTEASEETSSLNQSINVGDKLKVYYGPTNESKVTYEAKVVEIDKESSKLLYLVHYTGWNTRYDEWISPSRIAENLSATGKSKRIKGSSLTSMPKQLPVSSGPSAKVAARRGRAASSASKSAGNDVPRSTTPSSTTSTSSRNKSPATTVVRSSGRVPRKEYKRTRRTSVQTDTSIPSDSDLGSDSEAELTRTRSGSKIEDVEIRTYKKKPPRLLSKTKTGKKLKEEDDESEKDEEFEEKPKRMTRQLKRSPEKLDREIEETDEEDNLNPPKGRDFDLNQIRSELKGFTKALSSVDEHEKENSSSSEDLDCLNKKIEIKIEPNEEDTKKQFKQIDKNIDSDDIYEFKEPEPFEFETCSKLMDEKGNKKRLSRIYEDIEKVHNKIPIKEDTDKPVLKMSPIKTDDSDEELVKVKKEDPFDKLVESPCYNVVKTSSKISLSPRAPNSDKNLLEEPLNIFKELPEETGDDFSRDMELSDTESQTQPIFSRRDEIFSDTFGKSSSEQNTLDLEFSKSEERNVDDDIQASIQRAIQQSSTDDESQDNLLVTPISSNYQNKKIDNSERLATNLFGISSRNTLMPNETKTESLSSEEEAKPVCEKEKSAFSIIKQLASVGNNTNTKESFSISSATVTLCTKSEPNVSSSNLMVEESIKSSKSHKIVDTILQKFNSLNKTEVPVNELNENERATPEYDEYSFKEENNIEPECTKVETLDTSQDSVNSVFESTNIFVEHTDLETLEQNENVIASPTSESSEHKKKKKIISKPYIESDSDSSNSDNLVIARSDDESQTTFEESKPLKEICETKDVSITILENEQTIEVVEERNFNFDEVEIDNKTKSCYENSPNNLCDENKNDEEEEPDSHLHSLLLCEETIPRSPAPSNEVILSEEPPKRSKSALEMPFASAPGSSNNKNMLLGNEPVKLIHQSPLLVAVENIGNSNRDASAVLENTPPTTPESSSISNLSPQDNNGGLSPNTRDDDYENFKTNDSEDYISKRSLTSNKMSPYSEEDTQQVNDSLKKSREELMVVRKRRRSFRGEESPAKRGRKPLNRTRHNSDSDDTSDQSLISNSTKGIYERNLRSPRPSKYNFFVEFDPGLDSSQRIAVLQQKLVELRKTYADVKAELAAVERRRKKLRRRDREALKATKQEMNLCIN